MRPGPAIAVVVLLAACGQQPVASVSPKTSPSPTFAATPSASPPPSPTPPSSPGSATTLFAVVEGYSPAGSEPNTVAIVGMDGYAKAKATFTPRQRPFIGNAAVPLQPVAQVAGSAVYFIDGYGTVRSLRAGGQPQTLASFSTQLVQYETWFAVAPDGSSVMAGVLQYPAIGAAPSPCEGLTCMPPLVGPWTYRLMVATSGAAPVVLQHSQSSVAPDMPSSGWPVTFPVAWVAAGPVAMVPVNIGTQNAWWGGPLYLLDMNGKQVRRLGGADCDSDIVVGGNLIPCTSGQYAVTIRDLSGSVLWSSQVEGFNALGLRLSPDGQGITDGTKVETRTGGLVAMPQGFQVEGWLDDHTVVGYVLNSDGLSRGDLSWISVSDPGTVHDLGFKGDFVGTLS